MIILENYYDNSMVKCELNEDVEDKTILQEDGYRDREPEYLPYRCQVCGKGCKGKTHLKDHMLVHNKKHKCSSCGKAFAKKADMREHINVVHEGLKLHKCEICDKDFGYRAHLAQHLKTCAVKKGTDAAISLNIGIHKDHSFNDQAEVWAEDEIFVKLSIRGMIKTSLSDTTINQIGHCSPYVEKFLKLLPRL